MIQSRKILCSAGSHGSTHLKNTGIIKARFRYSGQLTNVVLTIFSPTLTVTSKMPLFMIARASGNWSTLGKVKKQPYVTVEPSLSNGKAGGVDGVSHEHLLAASGVIALILDNIYTWMLSLGHVSESMKKMKSSRYTKVVRSERTIRAIIEPLHFRPLLLSC